MLSKQNTNWNSSVKENEGLINKVVVSKRRIYLFKAVFMGKISLIQN